MSPGGTCFGFSYPFHFLAWHFSDAAAGWEGRPLADTPSCQPGCARTFTRVATCPPWGRMWVTNAALWVAVSTAPRSVQHDGAQNVLMELLPLFSVSFSALFPSYFLGSLPKINTFEKCLVSRSAFPQKAGLRPMGLVSVP